MTTGYFTSVDDVSARLAETGYLASRAVATTVFLADRLGKPLLVEGPAGVGKTELAKAVAQVAGAELIRLQCYEGVDESRALYEWNHAKQLLRITAGRDESWDETRTDIFGEEFLLSRPLLTAIRGGDPKVLLIDEMDKADVEVEGLLLEVLSDFQVTVPELGTITATRRPFVVLTSNASRELSEALRRRCLFLHIGFPEEELERRIVRMKVPGLDEALAASVVRVVGALRAMDLRKVPSVSETVDWARTLLALGSRHPRRERGARQPRRPAQAPGRHAEGRRQTRPGRRVTALPDRVTELVRTLRTHGLRIGPGETVDAAAALEVLGLDDRERVREGLAAALLHSEGQRAVFDPVFDLYFPLRVGAPVASDGDTAGLRERLAAALAANDQAALGQLAAEAVDSLGGYGSSPGSDGFSAHQTLDRLRPQTLLARVRATLTQGAQGARTAQGGDFTDRLTDDEIRRRIEGSGSGWAPRRAAGSPSGAAPTRSRAGPCGPPPTGSTSWWRAAPNSTSCAGRCTRWRANWPPAWRRAGAARRAGGSICAAPCAARCRPAASPCARCCAAAVPYVPS